MKAETLVQTESFWGKICFDGKFKPQGRFRVYREMISERFLETVQNISPVARSFLSEAEWSKLLWDFLKNQKVESEILRDLPYQLSQYLKTEAHPLKRKYPFLGELLEYEYLEIVMRFVREDAGKTPRGMLRLNPAHVLGTFRWPVHFISEKFRDPKKLPQGEYHLLLWREPESLEVKFMDVNALAASLVKRLERGPAKASALLAAVAKQHRLKASSEFMREGKDLIADLAEKHILV